MDTFEYSQNNENYLSPNTFIGTQPVIFESGSNAITQKQNNEPLMKIYSEPLKKLLYSLDEELQTEVLKQVEGKEFDSNIVNKHSEVLSNTSNEKETHETPIIHTFNKSNANDVDNGI